MLTPMTGRHPNSSSFPSPRRSAKSSSVCLARTSTRTRRSPCSSRGAFSSHRVPRQPTHKRSFLRRSSRAWRKRGGRDAARPSRTRGARARRGSLMARTRGRAWTAAWSGSSRPTFQRWLQMGLVRVKRSYEETSASVPSSMFFRNSPPVKQKKNYAS